MSLRGKKVLITCGPTWVPVDSMRVISNQSTGELGHILAQDLQKTGAQVTLLEGPVSRQIQSPVVKIIKFAFYEELGTALKKELTKSRYDIVIHAAAVADYKLKQTFKNKISSGLKQLTFQLVPTKKIINQIKRWSPKTFLVGFKLESQFNPLILKKKSLSLIEQAGCDLVVANSLAQGYKAFIINTHGQIVEKASSKANLSRGLLRMLEKCL